MIIDKTTRDRTHYIVLQDGRKVLNCTSADSDQHIIHRTIGPPLDQSSGLVEIIKIPEIMRMLPHMQLTPELYRDELSQFPDRYVIEWTEPLSGLNQEGKETTACMISRISINDALITCRGYHGAHDRSDISEYDMLYDMLVVNWGWIVRIDTGHTMGTRVKLEGSMAVMENQTGRVARIPSEPQTFMVSLALAHPRARVLAMDDHHHLDFPFVMLARTIDEGTAQQRNITVTINFLDFAHQKILAAYIQDGYLQVLMGVRPEFVTSSFTHPYS